MSDERAFGELLLSSIKLAVYDIVNSSRNSTPEVIKGILSPSSKKLPCPSNIIYEWHPSEAKGSYEFLFKDSSITRSIEESDETVDCSLKGYLNQLNTNPNIKEAREQITKQIINYLGYFPDPGIGFKVNVRVAQGKISMKRLETDVLDKLVILTRQNKLDWIMSEDPNDKGACPELLSKGMRVEGTFLASQENKEGSLTLTLSKYVKETKAGKAYSEYVICTQLIKGKNDSYDSFLVSRGVSKLWTMAEKGAIKINPGTLSVKELASFLTGLCEE